MITTGKVESNVYQKTVDYSDNWANGQHVLPDMQDQAALAIDRKLSQN